MTEILTYGAIMLCVLVVALLVYATTKPDRFCVSRATTIKAPPERIFPLIANLKSMNTWNPFVEPDPAIKISYSGPESGQGAAHTWAGNGKVGEGRIEITEAQPPSRVAMRLQMIKPMKADNAVEFTLAGHGSGTDVTWAMSGRQSLMTKLMTLFIDCERMVGSQFEKGLANLKVLAER
jgi:uncharacterized protein YndB with AHSA1/START domain